MCRPQGHRYWQRPEEGFGSLGIRDTGSCSLPDVSVSSQTLVLWKATITELLKQLASFTTTFLVCPHPALSYVHAPRHLFLLVYIASPYNQIE